MSGAMFTVEVAEALGLRVETVSYYEKLFTLGVERRDGDRIGATLFAKPRSPFLPVHTSVNLPLCENRRSAPPGLPEQEKSE